MDALYLFLLLAFFALSVGLIRFCAHLSNGERR